MQIQELIREFRYNSVTLADPNPGFTLHQVRDFFSAVYPDILNAEIEGPDAVGNKQVYTFRRAVGTKGGSTPGEMIADLATLLHVGWLDESDSQFIKALQERAQSGQPQEWSCDESLRLIKLHRQNCGPLHPEKDCA